ncbi:MAG: phosphatase PAP2 family protein [Clostridiales bacterium]|nr:phosphatase PAP2 family protein [Clostridiales bacterium]
MTFFFQWEEMVLLWIQENLRNEILTPIMKFITSLGNGGMIWILLTVILLIIPKTRRIGCMSAAALICSLLINNLLLKNLVARVRPYELIQNLTLLTSPAHDYSFPSGHTGSSLAAGWVMFRELPKKYGLFFLILALVIAFSRLYVGIHFPTDVLAGLLTGLLCGELGRQWILQIEKRKKKDRFS